MRRLIATALGTLATVAVVLVVLLGFGLAGASLSSAGHPTGAPTAAHSPRLAPMAVQPKQFVGGTPPTVAISGVTVFGGGPTATPATVFFNVTVGNVAPAGNFTLNINVSFTDIQTLKMTSTVALSAGVTNATNWSFPVSAANVMPDLLGSPTVGQGYAIGIFVQAVNLTNYTLNAMNASAWAQASTSGFFVFPAIPAPTVSVTFTSSIHGLYVVAPITETFTIAVTGTTIDPSTTTVVVEYKYFVGTHGTIVATDPQPVAPGQTSFSFNVTNSSATGGLLPVAPGGLYQMIALVTVVNPTAAVEDPTNASGTGQAILQANLVFSPLNGGFTAPSAGHYVGLGNVTVVIHYGGDFVQNAAVTVYRGTTANPASIVFTSPTFAPGLGNHTVAALNPWVASSAGTYLAVLYVNASYTNNSFSELINVTSAGGSSTTVVWVNSTTYHNSSLIPGLSTAAGGTLLLIIGLIVGLLVALVLGRMMWGSPKAAPAQQWQPKPGTNECSVCHQQFPTEDALKEHQKTAHGMG